MIPKIICLIFGHKRTWREFTGEYAPRDELSPLLHVYVPVPIYIERRYENCPRCGKMLIYA